MNIHTFQKHRGTVITCYVIHTKTVETTLTTDQGLFVKELYMLYFKMSCMYFCSCLVCIVVVILCVLL